MSQVAEIDPICEKQRVTDERFSTRNRKNVDFATRGEPYLCSRYAIKSPNKSLHMEEPTQMASGDAPVSRGGSFGESECS